MPEALNNTAKTEKGTYIYQSNKSKLEGTKSTNRGTRIVKPGSELDKNAFLKILAAELSNQDPTNAKDSSQYVTQMAQFASMEQMTNLNSTVSSLSAHALIGKGVGLNVADSNGVPYAGVVRAAENRYGDIYLGVEVNKDGKSEIMEFPLGNVTSIYETPNMNLDNLNFNTALLYASSMIGKNVEVNEKNAEGKNISGLVQGIFTENGVVNIKVKKEDGEIKNYPYSKVISITAP